MRISESIPGYMPRIGAAATPPSAASATPTPKMPVNSAGMLAPIPAAIGALSTPARTIAPMRLRSRKSHSISAIAKPSAIRNSR